MGKSVIPTQRFGVSVVLGTLIPAVMMSVSMWRPDILGPQTILWAPFVSGLAASFSFGATERPGITHLFPLGIVAFASFFCLTATLMLFFGSGPEQFAVMYLLIFPPYLLMIFLWGFVVSVLGMAFGWVVALAVRR